MTKEEVVKIFVNTFLIENYNFLEEDLVKLANTFAKAERANCIKLVEGVSPEAAEALRRKI